MAERVLRRACEQLRDRSRQMELLAEGGVDSPELMNAWRHHRADDLLMDALYRVVRTAYYQGETWAQCDRLLAAYSRIRPPLGHAEQQVLEDAGG